ncbi:MAG: esterase, depolymerase family [Myxococcaceae bacterium]|nr:esterase, depolymerase family [Myxococcaceae bacterium]
MENVLRNTVILLALAATSACAASSGDDGSAPQCVPGSKTATMAGAAVAAPLDAIASFGDNPGALQMFVHAPPGGKASAIVVAMHGCTQGAQDYVAAGWNDIADREGFAVVYPEQVAANNSNRCFNWYETGDTARGKGEARSIAAMTEHAKTLYGATRAYVTGLSAGAAMTAVMLATYPDLFEAGAIMAGIPYGCASSTNEAYGCMSGKDQTAAAWAMRVPAPVGGRAPRVSIWQGDADYIVRPTNAEQLVRQWTKVNALADKPTATTPDGKATHATYTDASGVVRVEKWSIAGMSHGVAVSPKDGCGKAGAYVIDTGLCSTEKAAEFFGLVAAVPPGSGPGGTTTSDGGVTPGVPTPGTGAPPGCD